MVKRRSLDDALTPEQEAFLTQGTSSKAPTSSKPKPKPEKEATPMSRTALKQNLTPQSSPPAVERLSSSYSAAGTGASNGAINARIDPAITTALLRASMERRISGQTPHTQRDIIADALMGWLKKHGYSL